MLATVRKTALCLAGLLLGCPEPPRADDVGVASIGQPNDGGGESADDDLMGSSDAGDESTSVADPSTSGDGTPEDTDDDDSSGDDGTPGGEVSWCSAMTNAKPEHECNPVTQDCPAGQKCMPYSDETTWDATACFPLMGGMPDQLGEACIEDMGGASGMDSCDVGLMCWDVDLMTGDGVCIALCTCQSGEPSCGAGQQCVVQNNDALTVCLDQCDPVLQDCPGGQGCYPQGLNFICAGDASGASGEFLDGCEFVNTCDPGLGCFAGASITGCMFDACCTPFCDVADPMGCPGGLACIAYYDNNAPPGLESVGLCAAP